MKKESITICVNNIDEAKKIRENFKQNNSDNKYRLHIIISGQENPITSLSQFLLSTIK